MKLKDIGDLANLTAGVGVIASLLFLAYEVRQNTLETRAATRNNVVNAIREMTLVRAQSPELSSAFGALSSCQQLTDNQLWHYRGYFIALMRSVEEAYFQFQEGRLDQAFFQTRLNSLNSMLQNEVSPGRNQFQAMKNNGSITKEFANIVDASIAERSDQERRCSAD